MTPAPAPGPGGWRSPDRAPTDPDAPSCAHEPHRPPRAGAGASRAARAGRVECPECGAVDGTHWPSCSHYRGRGVQPPTSTSATVPPVLVAGPGLGIVDVGVAQGPGMRDRRSAGGGGSPRLQGLSMVAGPHFWRGRRARGNPVRRRGDGCWTRYPDPASSGQAGRSRWRPTERCRGGPRKGRDGQRRHGPWWWACSAQMLATLCAPTGRA